MTQKLEPGTVGLKPTKIENVDRVYDVQCDKVYLNNLNLSKSVFYFVIKNIIVHQAVTTSDSCIFYCIQLKANTCLVNQYTACKLIAIAEMGINCKKTTLCIEP